MLGRFDNITSLMKQLRKLIGKGTEQLSLLSNVPKHFSTWVMKQHTKDSTLEINTVQRCETTQFEVILSLLYLTILNSDFQNVWTQQLTTTLANQTLRSKVFWMEPSFKSGRLVTMSILITLVIQYRVILMTSIIGTLVRCWE